MYNVTRILHLTDPTDTQVVIEQLRPKLDTTAASRIVAGATLPGVINGGDVIVHLQYADQEAWLAQRDVLDKTLDAIATTRIDGVDYAGGPAGVRDGYTGGADVYRTLLIHAEGSDGALAQFSADTLCMPRYVQSMLAWRLSPVDRAIGPTPWTHVWEQEYRDLDGLLGEYMLHPVHWAVVDRWFDPEFPDFVVRSPVCHTYCPSDGQPIIT